MALRMTPDWNDLSPFLALARAGSLAAAARALGTRHSTVASSLAPLIGPDLAALLTRWPGLAADVQSRSQTVDIPGGAADVDIRMSPVDEADLILRKIGIAGWSLYASRDYLAAHPYSGDLAGHGVIGLNADLADTPADRWLAEPAAVAHVVLRVDQLADLVATVQTGLGLALLPCVLADTADGLLRLTPEVLVHQPIHLVCRRDVAEDPRARRLLCCLANAIAPARPELEGAGR